MYIYELYTYMYTREIDTGLIFSKRKIEIKELITLIKKAIKIVNQHNADSTNIVCNKINEWVGGEPEGKYDIKEWVKIDYYFADENNYNDWLEKVIRPQFISGKFFAPCKYYIHHEDVLLYKPCKIGLNIIEEW